MEYPIENVFKLFKVSKLDSSEIVLKKAKKTYRQLCNKYHPDKGGDTEDFQKLQQAWIQLQEYCRKTSKVNSPLVTEEEDTIFIFFRRFIRKLKKQEGSHFDTALFVRDVDPKNPEELEITMEWVRIARDLNYLDHEGVVDYVPTGITLARFLMAHALKYGTMSRIKKLEKFYIANLFS